MNVKIEKFDHHGRGIGHINGKIIFIEDAMPDEEVTVEIDNDTAKFMEGHVLEYITTSEKRIKSKCPHFGVCGGCHLRSMSYEDTLIFKKNKIMNILKKYAGLEVNPIIVKNKNRDFYRNKVEIKVVNGIYGFYKKNSHDIVEIDRCLNAEEAINTILRSTSLFHIDNGTVTIKSNYNSEIIISITSDDENQVEIEKLRDRVKLVGVLYNEKLIFGTDHFIEIIDNKLFKETYNSFFQINRYINEELFKIIDENIQNEDVVVDMCSGVGTLSIVASYKAKKVYSLEIVENAIKDGIVNAGMNKRDNIEFIKGDAYANIGKIEDDIDTYIIDPPRSGLNRLALETILKQEPRKVIYVSCDPITLSRDLKVLTTKYNLDKLYILDMFSYTYHVECCALLSLKKIESSMKQMV